MDDEVIRAEFKRVGGNISRLARSLDLDYTDMRKMFATTLTPVRRPTTPMPENIRTLGNAGLKHCVIAVKAADSADWPEQFQEVIRKGRADFDAGTHMMCQNTREDGWVVLYSIARKVPLRNPVPFFSREWGYHDADR